MNQHLQSSLKIHLKIDFFENKTNIVFTKANMAHYIF